MKNVVLAAAVVALTSTSANAALIVYNVRVYGEQKDIDNRAAPVSGLLVDFNIAFDDAVNTTASTQSGLTIKETNLNWANKFAYSFRILPPNAKVLHFGTNVIGAYTQTRPDQNDFNFTLNISQSPTSYNAFYSNSTGKSWNLQTKTLLTNITSAEAVPEPATWALMIMGFGMVGCAMRRRSAAYSPAQKALS